MEKQNQLFRQKSMDRISSPEELHDYMRVTSPRLWMILSAIVILVAGFVVYAATTRMESTEKVQLRITDERSGYARIPAGREDLIKIGMEVRIAGHTGRVTQIDNTIDYVLNVSFDGAPPTDSSYYLVSIGEERDIQIVDEEGNYNYGNLIYIYQEDGVYYFMNNEAEYPVFRYGDTRARFWTEDYSTEPVSLVGGRLATISGVNQIISTIAYIQLDGSDEPLEMKVYDGEIVTENTTPLSFLLN